MTCRTLSGSVSLVLAILGVGCGSTAVGLRRGSCGPTFGDIEEIASPPGLGVQVLDVDGDGSPEILVRESDHGGLRVLDTTALRSTP